MSDGVFDPEWDDETEDQFKKSWDFHDADGNPVRDLATLEAVSGRSAESWVPDILHLPVGRVAPEELVQECLSRAQG